MSVDRARAGRRGGIVTPARGLALPPHIAAARNRPTTHEAASEPIPISLSIMGNVHVATLTPVVSFTLNAVTIPLTPDQAHGMARMLAEQAENACFQASIIHHFKDAGFTEEETVAITRAILERRAAQRMAPPPAPSREETPA